MKEIVRFDADGDQPAEKLLQHRRIVVDAAEQDAPALGPCVQAVEDYADTLEAPAFDVREDYARTVVGRMVKTILAPFGYEVTRQKGLPKKWRGRYFASASCYRLTGRAVMRVVRRLEEIPADEGKGG